MIPIITLSVCIIVKNEELVIGRCLECIKPFADEIIVVDTGSTDQTVEIVKTFTDYLYHFDWIEDFSAARNFSFSKATCDYIMWVDADDVITMENIHKIIELKKTIDPSINTVMMKYHVAFDENDNPTFSYFRERILKRGHHYPWIGQVHETIQPNPSILYSDAFIEHRKLQRSDPKRNLRIFENLIAKGELIDPRQQFYYARELYYNNRIEEAIEMFSQYLISDGWVADKISACSDLSACYYLINDDENALQSLFRSFTFDKPHAETCCNIGKHFLDREQYIIAIYWYEQALSAEKNDMNGFIMEECYAFTPYLQLCVCYDRLKDYTKAEEYNEKAALLKPNNKAVLLNRQYFNGLSQ